MGLTRMEYEHTHRSQRGTIGSHAQRQTDSDEIDLSLPEGAALAALLDRIGYREALRHARNEAEAALMLQAADKLLNSLRGAGYYY